MFFVIIRIESDGNLVRGISVPWLEPVQSIVICAYFAYDSLCFCIVKTIPDEMARGADGDTIGFSESHRVMVLNDTLTPRPLGSQCGVFRLFVRK